MSFELKFPGPAAAAAHLVQAIGAVCTPDPQHPHAVVHSVYFDDGRLSALAEVQNGDHRKEKVRVRWYEPDTGEACFLECKQRLGATRTKSRVAVEAPRTLPLHDARWREVLRHLPPTAARRDLTPSLHLSYRRHRFVSPDGSLRLSLDHDIRLVRVHPRLCALQRLCGRTAPRLVFELKGAERELPAALSFLPRYGLRREAFSKYGLWHAELEALTS